MQHKHFQRLWQSDQNCSTINLLYGDKRSVRKQKSKTSNINNRRNCFSLACLCSDQHTLKKCQWSLMFCLESYRSSSATICQLSRVIRSKRLKRLVGVNDLQWFQCYDIQRSSRATSTSGNFEEKQTHNHRITNKQKTVIANKTKVHTSTATNVKNNWKNNN